MGNAQLLKTGSVEPLDATIITKRPSTALRECQPGRCYKELGQRFKLVESHYLKILYI